jgi:hypothetical protein
MTMPLAVFTLFVIRIGHSGSTSIDSAWIYLNEDAHHES